MLSTTKCFVQPIKIKRQHVVENAIMCQIKAEHNSNEVRLAAMDKRNPLFAFMFGKDGNLMTANMAALHKYGAKNAGRISYTHVLSKVTF